jgi:hypothetical protein
MGDICSTLLTAHYSVLSSIADVGVSQCSHDAIDGGLIESVRLPFLPQAPDELSLPLGLDGAIAREGR